MITLLAAVGFHIGVLCIIGDTVTTRFDEINGALWNCPWFEFPRNVRKCFPMILSFAQKPVYMEGFMNVQCTREVMKKVILEISS